MNFKQFLLETERGKLRTPTTLSRDPRKPLKPETEAGTEMRGLEAAANRVMRRGQQNREIGDVGPVERLKQVYKQKDRNKRLKDSGGERGGTMQSSLPQELAARAKNPELARKADEVLQDVTGIKTSDRKRGQVRQAVDMNNDQQYQSAALAHADRVAPNWRQEFPDVNPDDIDDEIKKVLRYKINTEEPDPEKILSDIDPAKLPRGFKGWFRKKPEDRPDKPEYQEFIDSNPELSNWFDTWDTEEAKDLYTQARLAMMPHSERMAMYHDYISPRGLADGMGLADTAMRAANTATARAQLRDPIKLNFDGQDVEIGEPAYFRHAQQAADMGIESAPEIQDGQVIPAQGKSIDADAVDRIISATMDPEGRPIDPNDPSALATARRRTSGESKGDTTDSIHPTARDMIAHSSEVESRANNLQYLDDETLERQALLRDALTDQQSDKVQELAFRYDDVSDEMVQRYARMHGVDKNKIASLGDEQVEKFYKEIATQGAMNDPKRRHNFYGGNIEFDGIDEFRPDRDKINKGRNEEISDEIYNTLFDLNKLDAAIGSSRGIRQRELQNLKTEIMVNRAKELIRTYLKQGGVDPYASHEGIRGMFDMDMEHIRSLNRKGADGGFDHPSNWVYASEPLNQLRKAVDLPKSVKTFERGRGSRTEFDKDEAKNTYNNFIDDQARKAAGVGASQAAINREKRRLKQELPPPSLAAGNLENMSPEKREQEIEKFVNMGMDRKQAEKAVPQVTRQYDQEEDISSANPMENPNNPKSAAGTKENVIRPAIGDDDEFLQQRYDMDITNDLRLRSWYYNGIDRLLEITKMTPTKLKKSPIFDQFIEQLKDRSLQMPGLNIDEPQVADEPEIEDEEEEF